MPTPPMQTEERQSNPELLTLATDDPPAPAPPPPERVKSSRASRLHAGVVARFAFTSRQIRGMAVVLVIVVGVLGWRLVRDRAFISDPQPPEGSRSAELACRLDPN